MFIFEPDPETGAFNHFIMMQDGVEIHFYRD
jgi:hypothetical protein